MDIKAAIRVAEFRVRKAIAKELLDLADILMRQARRQIARARLNRERIMKALRVNVSDSWREPPSTRPCADCGDNRKPKQWRERAVRCANAFDCGNQASGYYMEGR